MKNAAIVENNIITNVIVIDDSANPADFGAIILPDGLWIGDEIPAPPAPVTDAEMAAAISEGVNAV